MKVPYIQKYFVEHTKWIYAWLLLQLFLLTAKGWILDINDQWGKKLYWNLFCVLRYSIYLKITHEQWVMWHLTALQISFCVLICTLANEQLHFQYITMINDTGWWHASDPIFFLKYLYCSITNHHRLFAQVDMPHNTTSVIVTFSHVEKESSPGLYAEKN